MSEAEKNTQQTEATDTQATEASPKNQRSALPWLLLVILLALIAAAAAFVYFHLMPKHHAQLTTIQQQVAASQSQQQRLEEQLNGLQQKLERQVEQNLSGFGRQIDNALSQQRQQLDDYQLAVKSVQAELANLDISQESDWRIYEARNLVERAATKLWIEDEPQAALAFLKLAQSHLAALNNPAHMRARQALENDILALEQLPNDQVEAVSLALGALADQVQRSRWYQQLAMSSKPAEPTTEQSWSAHLQRSMQTLLQQFIRVQRRDTALEPMIADAYFDVVQQRTLLQLQLAQQAAVRGSQALYQQAVTDAVVLLENLAGKITDDSLIQVIAELKQLQNTALRPAYPSELSSFEAVERLAQQLHQGG